MKKLYVDDLVMFFDGTTYRYGTITKCEGDTYWVLVSKEVRDIVIPIHKSQILRVYK